MKLEDMVFIRDNLVTAELCRRQGDTHSVYAAFTKLADFYVATQDWKTSFFFHEKCLEVAQLTNDVRAEMKANHALGSTYQLMNDYEGARRFHERHEEIAASVDVLEETALANLELFKVYMVLAERLEYQKRSEEALQMYQRCLAASKKSWDRAAEGEANGRIGSLLLHRGDAQESLQYLRNQSQIAADLGNAEGRCRACSALSLALDSLGLADKALAELTLVHSISEQAGDVLLQAQACRALGTLYSKVGKLEAAVDILQRHFNLVKTILYRSNAAGGTGISSGTATTTATATAPSTALAGKTEGEAAPGSKATLSAKDLDLARVYIGISKGNLLLGAYSLALQDDLTALLDWKLNRTELSGV
jgi:tetratricopeptide (TPR) repeat protein